MLDAATFWLSKQTNIRLVVRLVVRLYETQLIPSTWHSMATRAELRTAAFPGRYLQEKIKVGSFNVYKEQLWINC